MGSTIKMQQPFHSRFKGSNEQRYQNILRILVYIKTPFRNFLTQYVKHTLEHEYSKSENVRLDEDNFNDGIIKWVKDKSFLWRWDKDKHSTWKPTSATQYNANRCKTTLYNTIP